MVTYRSVRRNIIHHKRTQTTRMDHKDLLVFGWRHTFAGVNNEDIRYILFQTTRHRSSNGKIEIEKSQNIHYILFNTSM